MKKLIFGLLSIIMILMNTLAFAEEIYVEDENFELPEIKAESAILMDMKSGRVIYSKNPDEQRFPASTTKIMTAILALEHGNLSDVVTADVASLAPITNEDSHMGILIGEELTMEQLLNGMLVYSANDAANVIATHIGGSPEHFVDLMNQKAQEIGATNTNFVNTYGIHDENHYTSAADLAIMARYAMENEQFREIVKKKSYTIPATNKYLSERVLPATNLFVGTARSQKYYYDAVTGIKTGFTNAAGYCLVSSAEKDGTELLCIVMKSANQEACYTTSKALLQYGFENYKYQTIAKSGEVVTNPVEVNYAKNKTQVGVTVASDVSVLLPVGKEVNEVVETVIDVRSNLSAPISKGDPIGTVSYNYKGTLLGYRDLIAANDIERDNLDYISKKLWAIVKSPYFFIPVVIIIMLFVIRRINIMKQEKLKRLRRLHAKESNQQMRSGTKKPVNTRFADTSKRHNSNSRYRRK